MQIVLLLGLILISGLAAGRVFERMGIPQVVGYIVIGVIAGDSVTHLIPTDLLDQLSAFTSIALAFIGFMVGGELKYSVFKKFGKQFLVILLCEGLLAMAAVAIATTWLTGNAALGILLGALSSATAPAATVDVLWEYRSKGPLTTTILAIVALDDGLALVLYGFAFAFAGLLISGEALTARVLLLQPLTAIAGSLLLGGAIALLLDRLTRFIKTADDQLVLNVSAVLVASGLALFFDYSLILTSMAMGLVLTNIHPDRNESHFKMIKSFVPPIFIIFFIFVGARLRLSLLSQIGTLGLLYITGRTVGKWSGAYLGARVSGAAESVRKYLGFALFSQAGVAVGLALDIYQHFSRYGSHGAQLGHTVITVIAATTLVVQIIGPPSVKYAISKAGEIPTEASTA